MDVINDVVISPGPTRRPRGAAALSLSLGVPHPPCLPNAPHADSSAMGAWPST